MSNPNRAITCALLLAVIFAGGAVGCGKPAQPAAPSAAPTLAPRPADLVLAGPYAKRDAPIPDWTSRPPATAPAAKLADWAYKTAQLLVNLAYVGMPPPRGVKLIPVGHTIIGPCSFTPDGKVTSNDLWYCDTDDTFYIGAARTMTIAGKNSLAALLAVVLHEYTHHVEKDAGGMPSVQTEESNAKLEMQANCGSGAVTALAVTMGVVLDGEMPAVVWQMMGSGKPGDSTHKPKDGHDSFIDGYKHGLLACNRYNTVIALPPHN